MGSDGGANTSKNNGLLVSIESLKGALGMKKIRSNGYGDVACDHQGINVNLMRQKEVWSDDLIVEDRSFDVSNSR